MLTQSSKEHSKPRLVVITSRFPFPLDKGDKLRIFNQLVSLVDDFQVILIALNDDPLEEAYIELLERIVDELYILKVGGFYRAFSLLTGILSRRPFELSYFYSSKVQNEINAIIQKEKPNLIYAHLLRSAQYVTKQRLPVVVDYMDAFSLIMHRRASKTRGIKQYFYTLESIWMKTYERQVARSFQRRLMISQQDADYLNKNNEDFIDFDVVPNGVDLDFYQNQTDNNVAPKYDLVFVGNMGYEPNIRAVHFLVEKILPLLKVEIPNIKILIAGARPTRSVRFLASSNVAVSGWIDDIREAYLSARVMIAPIFSGAGQQNKILEAMSMGVPCIATTSVNNAIGAEHDKEIIIADTAEEFVNASMKLLILNNYRDLMIHNARSFVTSKYSWQKCNNLLIENLKKALP